MYNYIEDYVYNIKFFLFNCYLFDFNQRTGTYISIFKSKSRKYHRKGNSLNYFLSLYGFKKTSYFATKFQTDACGVNEIPGFRHFSASFTRLNDVQSLKMIFFINLSKGSKKDILKFKPKTFKLMLSFFCIICCITFERKLLGSHNKMVTIKKYI